MGTSIGITFLCPRKQANQAQCVKVPPDWLSPATKSYCVPSRCWPGKYGFMRAFRTDCQSGEVPAIPYQDKDRFHQQLHIAAQSLSVPGLDIHNIILNTAPGRSCGGQPRHLQAFKMCTEYIALGPAIALGTHTGAATDAIANTQPGALETHTVASTDAIANTQPGAIKGPHKSRFKE